LLKYSFEKEHENVYFSKEIDLYSEYKDQDISFTIENTQGNKHKIIFSLKNEQIGYCQLEILQNNISYLFIIEIFKNFRRQGFGERCMKILLNILEERKIKKIDLDTIDSNYIAKNLYKKIGFINKGITRSYNKK